MKRLLAILALAAALLPAAVADAAFPGRNGKIAFGWEDGGDHWDEVLGDAQFNEVGIKLGGRLIFGCSAIFVPPAPDPCAGLSYRYPSFSPDGQRLVLDAGASLATVGADGEDYVQLPQRGEDDSSPAFGPGGRRIVFSSGPSRRGAVRDLWISDDDGEHARRLVRRGATPAWSSRNWIAFVRHGAIYRVRPDGRGLRAIMQDAFVPVWSPDGRHLAFVVERTRRRPSPRRAGVWVARLDGSGMRRVAPSLLWEIAWSPDGRKLALQGMERYTLDLRTGREHYLGESEYAGAYSVSSSHGLDWQPLP